MTEATWCERCDETGAGPCRCDRAEAQGQDDARELARLRAELTEATQALQVAFETATENLGELVAEIVERTSDVPCSRCGNGCRDHRSSRGERVCIFCIELERDEMELQRAALQDLACKVLAVLEDEPRDEAVPLVIELLNEHLEADHLTFDYARLGELTAVAGAQDEQADLLEALATELERIDDGKPGQTQAIADDLAERDSCLLMEAWLGRLWGALREARTPERWCTHCRVMTRRYDPAFRLHNECGQMTAATSDGASKDCDDGDPCTTADAPTAADLAAENVCEHGDHEAPAGKRFCSDACERCEHESTNEDTGCDGICGGDAADHDAAVLNAPLEHTPLEVIAVAKRMGAAMCTFASRDAKDRAIYAAVYIFHEDPADNDRILRGLEALEDATDDDCDDGDPCTVKQEG